MFFWWAWVGVMLEEVVVVFVDWGMETRRGARTLSRIWLLWSGISHGLESGPITTIQTWWWWPSIKDTSSIDKYFERNDVKKAYAPIQIHMWGILLQGNFSCSPCICYDMAQLLKMPQQGLMWWCTFKMH
jgi:hypothetical protein